MADQRRWFKVWTSIAANGRFAEMSLEDIGRWTLLGAAMALDGDHGTLQVPGEGRELCRLLRVPSRFEAFRLLLRWPSLHVSTAPLRWPHGREKPPVCDGFAWAGGSGWEVTECRGGRVAKCQGSPSLEEWCLRHDTMFVTMNNWMKYQEDTTMAARGKTSRNKRRGEEKRREENPPTPQSCRNGEDGSATPSPPPPSSPDALPSGMVWGPYGPTPTPPPPTVHAVDHGQPGMTLPEWLALEAARQAGLAPPRAPRVPPRATGQWLPNPPEETRP
jgi:hypothetical protein